MATTLKSYFFKPIFILFFLHSVFKSYLEQILQMYDQSRSKSICREFIKSCLESTNPNLTIKQIKVNGGNLDTKFRLFLKLIDKI